MKDLFDGLQLARDLIERRDRVKAIYGDSYPEKMQPVYELIRLVAKRTSTSFLDAGRELATKAFLDGHAGACNALIAGAVDLSEGRA